MKVPVFKVLAGDNDVTDIVKRHLVQLRLTSSSDRFSDTLELELSDADNVLNLPTAERELQVEIGYRDFGLAPMGLYFHTESEIQLAPRRLTVRATAADFRRQSSLKVQKRRAWENVSLGDVVAAIAAEHGYAGRVHSSLAGIVIPHIDQTAETDLHLLHRLARHYDATIKADGAHLVFVPRGLGRSAGDHGLPVATYAPRKAAGGERTVLSARYTVKGRPRFDAVVATYQDVAAGRLVHVQAGSGSIKAQIREPLPDRAQAEAAAAARLKKLSRQEKELELVVSGNPLLKSEAVVVLKQWPLAEGSRWTVLRAEHSISKGRGYVTSVTAEPLEA